MLLKDFIIEAKDKEFDEVGRWNPDLTNRTDAEHLHILRSNGVPYNQWSKYAKTYVSMKKEDDGSYVRYSDYKKLLDAFKYEKSEKERKAKNASKMINDLKKGIK